MKASAREHRRFRNIYDWLVFIGLVPEGTEKPKPVSPVLLDPKAVNVGYLASVAAEWDEWGESSPVEFMRAMKCEVIGHRDRDAIAHLLFTLGRHAEEEPVAA